MKYEFVVPFLPPSVNSMYGYNRYTKQRFLTKEAQQLKCAISIACPKMSFSVETPRLDFKVEYHSSRWVCKNGKYRKVDGANMDKLVMDAVSEKIGYDDSLIFMWAGSKVIDEKEFTKIVVEEIA